MKIDKKKTGYWIIAIVVALGIIAFSGYELPILISKGSKAILEGEIKFISDKNLSENDEKIPAGSPVTLLAKIKNKGTLPNAPGEIFIRFSFSKPMDEHVKSVIFETEKMPLDILQPNQQVELTFKNTHQWPSLADFIKNDWPMREYQLVALIGQQEFVIGTKYIAFSAYYYGGASLEIDVTVPAFQQAKK